MAAILLIATGVAAAAGVSMVNSWLADLPNPDTPGAFDVAQATRIYSADGKLLARLYLENREVIPIDDMSPYLLDAIVAVEDERFYEHNGVDLVGLGRAVVVNLTQGFGEEGASTITQQYIRNTILLDERTDITLARKAREAYLALELEKRYSKKEILGMYLNAIYFGDGAYGAQAAAEDYFGKDAKDLTVAEAALLAGLPQQPSRLDPWTNLSGAITRRNEVLSRMLSNGYITREQYDEAIAEEPNLKKSEDPENGIYAAPYFVAHVKKLLQEQFSAGTVFKGGLVVHTTLDTRLQKYAESAVKKALPSKSDPEAALVSIDPDTGYVKAMVGGRNYSKSKFNLATQGKRQAGSSFKTFVLVTALDEGMPPTYRIDSSSPAYIDAKPKAWVVSNSEGQGHGLMTLEAATRSSVNTVFARVAKELGAKKIAKTATKMGITTKVPNYLSISLGTLNVSPLEMASAYGTLATGGIHHDPIVITEVVDHQGETIYKANKKGKRVISKEVAWAATKILKGVISGGTATRANIGRPAAGKTGTSQNNRDAWFVGYTPQLVTSVWVGYKKERTVYVNGSVAYGGTAAAPIWAAYMRKALKGEPSKDFQHAKAPEYDASQFHIPRSGVPDIVGLKLAKAIKQLDGYSYDVRYEYSKKPKGTVIKRTVDGDKLILVVSKGPKPEEKTADDSTDDSGSKDDSNETPTTSEPSEDTSATE